MGADLNALGLILVIVLTGAVLVRHGTRTGSLQRAPLAIAVAFPVMWLASILFATWDYGEDTSRQVLIPLVCLALLLAFTRPGHVRMIAALAVALSTFVLSFQILLLVHSPVYSSAGSPTYMGNPNGVRSHCEAISRSKLHEVRSWLDEIAKDDDHEYPASWLADSRLRQFLPSRYVGYTRGETVEFRPFWHSPLTGLYWASYHRLDLWYPGGRLKDGLKRLEFRPRQPDEKR